MGKRYKYITNSYHAVGVAEGFEEASCEEEVLEAWQYLIDTGQAWTLQGKFGRMAAALIEEGLCQAAQ